MACRGRSVATTEPPLARVERVVSLGCRLGGSSSGSNLASSIRPRHRRTADTSGCIAPCSSRPRSRRRRMRPSSKRALMCSATITTRNGRMRRWASVCPANSIRRRIEQYRSGRSLVMTKITRFVGSTLTARSNGEVIASSSARRSPASSLVWPSSKPATISSVFAAVRSVCSMSLAASAASLRLVMGSANRLKRPPQFCRQSSRSKMSTIMPVEPQTRGHAPSPDLLRFAGAPFASRPLPARGARWEYAAPHSFHPLRLEHRFELLHLMSPAECEERLVAGAVRQIGLEHALDGRRRVRGLDVAKNLTAERGVGAEAAADQHMIALDRVAVGRGLDLAGDQADIADIVLRTRMMAAGEMDVERRVEGDACLAPLRDLLGMALGIGGGEAAADIASAGDKAGAN